MAARNGRYAGKSCYHVLYGNKEPTINLHSGNICSISLQGVNYSTIGTFKCFQKLEILIFFPFIFIYKTQIKNMISKSHWGINYKILNPSFLRNSVMATWNHPYCHHRNNYWCCKALQIIFFITECFFLREPSILT